MEIQRLSSYKKRIAQIEMGTPKIIYVGTFQALKEDTKKYFDPFDAGEFKPRKYMGSNVVTCRNVLNVLIELHQKYNRDLPLSFKHNFYYKCDYETESYRLAKAKDAILHRMKMTYPGVELHENVHFKLTIEKQILE